jgi:hypothetical protein
MLRGNHESLGFAEGFERTTPVIARVHFSFIVAGERGTERRRSRC